MARAILAICTHNIGTLHIYIYTYVYLEGVRGCSLPTIEQRKDTNLLHFMKSLLVNTDPYN